MDVRLRRVAVAALACSAAFAAHAAHAAALSVECGPPPSGAMCLDGPWFEFATLTVDVTQGEARSRYGLTVASGRDLLATIEEANPNYRGRAEVLLIDGSLVAEKSDRSLPSAGADLLNDPLLAAQEVASLLQLALPRGPRKVTKATPVRAAGTRILAMNTPGMSSYFGPPWTLEGSIAPRAKGAFAFELKLTYRIARPDGTLTDREHAHRYTGRVGYPARRPRLPDSTPLAGWRIEAPGGALLEFPTLGAARRTLGVAPPR
ncbi:hypothetical protein BURK1_02355 [Burkholderiales bacterium]|nr:hypothetical protein BURK1_02355 [Burkholderiales bacterium]